MGISFNRKRLYGVEIYDSLDSDKFSIVHLDNGYNIRIRDDNQNWVYPIWRDKSFKNLEDAQLWLNLHNLKTATPSHIEYDDTVFASIALTALSDRLTILAAVNTKNLAQNLSRVRSSNVWAYGLNLKDRKDKTGDLLVQFKAKGRSRRRIHLL